MRTSSQKEDRLLKLNSDNNLKTRKIDTLTKDLQSMNEQLALLNKTMTDTSEANEEKVAEKRRNLKARKEEANDLEASNRRKRENLERKRKEADGKKRQTERLTKQMEERRQEIKEKEER